MSDLSMVSELDQSQLREAVEAAAGRTLRSYEIVAVADRAGTSGICGVYAVTRIIHTAADGARGEVRLFVRRDLEPKRGFHQEHHYRTLPGLGLPTPRLYGAWADEQGREVLVLEHVEAVGADEEQWLVDAGNCRSLISLIASMVSVDPPAGYLALVGRDMAQRGAYTRGWNIWLPWSIHVIGRVWEHAARGELGTDVGTWCADHSEARGALQESARLMLNTTRRLEVGLIHGDLHPGNVGRRADGTLVLFDFGDVMIDFRLYDLALYLGSPEGMRSMAGASAEDLAAQFVAELRARGVRAPAVADLLRDARLIWHTRKLNLWELVPKELGGFDYYGPAGEDTREKRQRRLLELLRALTAQLPEIHGEQE